jgi:hypothetical protein
MAGLATIQPFIFSSVKGGQNLVSLPKPVILSTEKHYSYEKAAHSRRNADRRGLLGKCSDWYHYYHDAPNDYYPCDDHDHDAGHHYDYHACADDYAVFDHH